jgi:hypothetical protein
MAAGSVSTGPGTVISPPSNLSNSCA